VKLAGRTPVLVPERLRRAASKGGVSIYQTARRAQGPQGCCFLLRRCEPGFALPLFSGLDLGRLFLDQLDKAVDDVGIFEAGRVRPLMLT